MGRLKGGRRMLLVLTIILVTAALLLLLTALLLAGITMTGRRQTMDEAMAWQSEHYDTSFYDACERETYTVTGAEGYELHVELLKSPGSTRYMILSHGYTDTRAGSLKYARFYLEMGFSCIIYDLRGHGENAPTPTTYGILEAQDLDALIADTHTRYPDLTVLGLHGESLGAATTVSVLRYRPDVAFAVADCGFSDIENVLRGGFRSAHLPSALFDLADVGARLRFGYALRDMRPIDALAENDVPLLFLHGADDTFILPQNSADMAAATRGAHELYLFEGAGHALSALTDPERYAALLRAFTDQYGAG